MKSETPEYIMEFMRAVYPECAELMLASFNEKVVLEDATKRIRELEGAYRRGVIEGLRQYAWWADGVQYVGTCGTTLSEAISKALSAAEGKEEGK